MRKSIGTAFLATALVAAGVTWIGLGGAADALPPSVYSVVEGREANTDQPVLVVFGRTLTSVRSYELVSNQNGSSSVLLASVRTKNFVVLPLPNGVAQGDYQLRASYGRGQQIASGVKLRMGSPMAGTIELPMLSGPARADLDDAESLEGKDVSFFRNASNLDGGALDAARFSAYDDLVTENRVGAASTQVARGDHEHDLRYVQPGQLSGTGTVNQTTNPVDWTKLKSVPAGLADGVDNDTTYVNGSGLSLTGTTFSLNFAGTGAAATAARSDHDHIGTYVRTVGETMTGTLYMQTSGLFANDQCLNATGTTGNKIAFLENAGTGNTLHVRNVGGTGDAIFAESVNSGYAIEAKASGTAANIAIFVGGTAPVARISTSGRGFFNGGTQTGGADFAESVAVDRPVREFEPGDVLVIDPQGVRRFAMSRTANSTAVAGVHSTKPGVLATPYDVADEAKLAARAATEIPLAITGIVPCKVCDEGGAIRAGDLLVTSSSAGRAMKAPPVPAIGTVVGKALGALERGRGVIEILVMAR